MRSRRVHHLTLTLTLTLTLARHACRICFVNQTAACRRPDDAVAAAGPGTPCTSRTWNMLGSGSGLEVDISNPSATPLALVLAPALTLALTIPLTQPQPPLRRGTPLTLTLALTVSLTRTLTQLLT